MPDDADPGQGQYEGQHTLPQVSNVDFEKSLSFLFDSLRFVDTDFLCYNGHALRGICQVTASPDKYKSK